MNNNEINSCCDNCLSNVLKVILILQENSECGDSCLDTCDRGFLGQQLSGNFYNTRPIVLYTCSSGSTPLSMPVSKSPTETTTSTIFRLEKLDFCCATFRVLVATTAEGVTTYTSTNSFFTINCNCLCAIRCLEDTYVEGV